LRKLLGGSTKKTAKTDTKTGASKGTTKKVKDNEPRLKTGEIDYSKRPFLRNLKDAAPDLAREAIAGAAKRLKGWLKPGKIAKATPVAKPSPTPSTPPPKLQEPLLQQPKDMPPPKSAEEKNKEALQKHNSDNVRRFETGPKPLLQPATNNEPMDPQKKAADALRKQRELNQKRFMKLVQSPT